MTTRPSVRQPAPDGDLIASWIDGWMRLERLDDDDLIVVIVRKSGRLHVADVVYGEIPTEVRWTRDGTMEIEQYKRDYWDTQIYSAVAQWRDRS